MSCCHLTKLLCLQSLALAFIFGVMPTLFANGCFVQLGASVDNTERSSGHGVTHQDLTVICDEAASRLGPQDKTT